MPKSPKPLPPHDRTAREDITIRKKKNADAQAAFRQRRANYIATLEASVTNLESVVLDLQDGLRKVKHERDVYQEQIREHAQYCKAIYPAKHPGRTLHDGQLTSSSPFSESSTASSQSTPHLHPFNNFQYSDAGPSTYSNASVHGASYTTSSFQNNDVPPDASGTPCLHRADGKYGAPQSYPYAMTESSREVRNGWQVPMANPALHGAGDAVMGGHHSQSPAYINSPSITSANDQAPPPPEFAAARIGIEDSKVNVGAPSHSGGPSYVAYHEENQYGQNLGSHPTSRAANPPHLSAPMPMTSSVAPFTFPDAPPNHSAEFDYRHPQSPQLIPPNDSLSGPHVQYTIHGRRASNESNLQEPDADHQAGMGKMRHDTISSRSPSPGRSSLSCSVAVIRAQSFGAHRRTRASNKKSSEAARITLNVLQSRGITLRDSSMASKQTFVADDEYHEADTP